MEPANVTVIVVSLVIAVAVLFGAFFAVYRWVMSPRAQKQYFERNREPPEENIQGV